MKRVALELETQGDEFVMRLRMIVALQYEQFDEFKSFVISKLMHVRIHVVP